MPPSAPGILISVNQECTTPYVFARSSQLNKKVPVGITHCDILRMLICNSFVVFGWSNLLTWSTSWEN